VIDDGGVRRPSIGGQARGRPWAISRFVLGHDVLPR
jgi:hypothetical protein